MAGMITQREKKLPKCDRQMLKVSKSCQMPPSNAVSERKVQKRDRMGEQGDGRTGGRGGVGECGVRKRCQNATLEC